VISLRRIIVFTRDLLIALCIGVFLTCAIRLVAQGSLETVETWGGEHVELQLGPKGGELTFDCATGHFDGRPKIDRRGRFSIKGTYTPEYHGPVRDDINLTRHVVYIGTIRKNEMTLEIQQEGAPTQAYSLTQGKTGAVTKCR
jgi:hypothetical protein